MLDILFTDSNFQAEEFNESVQVIREWLPQVEAELKFRSLPENEGAIVLRIEQHDVSSLLFLLSVGSISYLAYQC